MTSLSKKLTAALLAVMAAVCLAFGLLFTVPKTASAATAEITFNQAADFVIDDGVLSGLSETAKIRAGSRYFAIEIPDGVKTVAASDSTTAGILGSLSNQLVSLTIPSGVTAVGDYAFYGCRNIENIDLTGATALKTIGANAFNSGAAGSSQSNTLVSLTVPEGVTAVGGLAFANHTGLTEINFNATGCAAFASGENNPFHKAGYAGNSLTVNIGKAGGAPVQTVPENFFNVGIGYPSKVTRLNFVNAGTEQKGAVIGKNAFSTNKNLEQIDFGESYIAEIQTLAFDTCEALTEITIPAEVKDIGDRAFRDCTSVKKINYYAAASSSGTNAFSGSGTNAVLTVGGEETVTALPTYGFAGSNIVSANFVNVKLNETGFGSYLFNNCKKLKEVTFGANCEISSIQDQTFYGCTSLGEIAVPEGVTEIGKEAFKDCPSLYRVALPSTLTKIEEDAFINKTAADGYGGTTRVIEVENKSSAIGNEAVKGLVGNYALHVYAEGDSQIVEVGDFVFLKGEKSYLIKYTGGDREINLPALDGSYSYEIYGRAFMDNTDITSVNIPNGVTAIGEYAFSGCTRLEHVSIEINSSNGAFTLNSIGKYAFNGCINLSSITMPDTVTIIEEGTFKGCKQLLNIELPEGLLYIKESAFEGCSSFETVEIPSGVMEIGAYAFKNCSGLKAVFLPDDRATIGRDAFQIDGSSELILIASNSEDYEAYSSKTNVPTGSLTYPIVITLAYNNQEDHTITKYYNKTFNYEWQLINSEGGDTYEFVTDGGMPVQSGYFKSVWFLNNNCEGDPVDGVKLNALLAGDDPNWLEAPKLYAHYMEKPELELKGGLVYSADNIYGYSAEDIFKAFDVSSYTIKINAYRLISGSASEIPSVVANAGFYDISIKIYDEETYGQWDDFDQIYTVKVEPAPLTLNDGWELKDGSSLSSTTNSDGLYMYGEIPYTEKTDNAQSPLTGPTGKLTNSYVTFSYDGREIVYVAPEFITIVSGTYSGNFQNSAGRFTASVEVIVDSNYILSHGNNDDEKAAGINFEPIDGASRYSMTKVWYIVSDGSKHLQSQGGGAFEVNGWTYQDKNAKIPAEPVYEGAKLTFTLTRLADSDFEARTIIANQELGAFDSYFNNSMPAGTYLLEFKGADQPYNFTFTVRPADLKTLIEGRQETAVDSWIQDGVQKSLSRSEFTVRYNGNIYLNDGTVNLYAPTLVMIGDFNTRQKAWANSSYSDLYSGCEMTYNITNRTTGEESGEYYSEKNLSDSSVIPVNAGEYRIYYNIAARNFAPLTDVNTSDRNSYFYTLYIYRELGKSDLPEIILPYTGSAIKPNNIATAYYDALFLEPGSQIAQELKTEDRYINAGVHTVALQIRNLPNANYTKIYKWLENTNDANEKITVVNGYALYTFTIAQAENKETQQLSVIGWDWGEFNVSVNKPTWKTQFEAEYEFTIVNDATGKAYTYNGVNGKNFKDADAGTYTLFATAKASENVKKLDAESTIKLYIKKADLYWAKDPYVESWRYGDFARIEEPSPELHSSFSDAWTGANVYYCLADDYGKTGITVYGTLKELADKNRGEVPAGKYVLVYDFAEDTNYEAKTFLVYFSVLKAENYWDVTPTVYDWQYGELKERISAPNAVPHFGSTLDVELTYYKARNGVPVSAGYSSIEEMADEYGELKVGQYMLVATLKGDANYEAMNETRVTFNVSKVKNSWLADGIPTVVGWSEGRFNADKNYPTAQAKFGTVTYTIEDDKGNTYAIEDLSKLGVGSYKLTAFVMSSDDYYELTGVTYFAVFEDSVGMTGLIVATAIFAALAVGLAIAAVILLIRKNKKIEEDFRRLVKSELNRR